MAAAVHAGIVNAPCLLAEDRIAHLDDCFQHRLEYILADCARQVQEVSPDKPGLFAGGPSAVRSSAGASA